MSYTKSELTEVIGLCNQLAQLASDVVVEAENCRRWDVETRQYVTRAQWPYWGGTKASGAMRRKSMELTRALADLRKP